MITTERMEAVSKLAADLAKQEAERAAERAANDARSLASSLYSIQAAKDTDPRLAKKAMFSEVRRAVRYLDLRERSDDLAITPAIVSAYLSEGRDWIDAVIDALWEAKQS